MKRFPQISTSGMVGIRWFSESNQWLDVLVLVNKEDEQDAILDIQRAADNYWDNIYECYGDAVEVELGTDGIPFVAIYHDSEDESFEYEKEWNAVLDGVEIVHTIR